MMMKTFLASEQFGNLYIDEVFVFYDQPQVFTCKNVFGHTYIFTYADYDDISDTWIVSPVSGSRLSELKKRKISLYDALTKPEDNSSCVFIVKKNHLNHAIDIQKTPVEAISSDLLPERDFYIAVSHEYLPIVDNRIVQIATNERRDVAFISFADRTHRYEINASVFASLVFDLQSTIIGLAYGGSSIRGRIPKKIVEDTQLQITGLAAASFGVQIMSYEIADLLGETTVSKPFLEAMDIIEASQDVEKIKSLLNNKNPRAALHLLRFYKMLSGNDLNCLFEFSSAKGVYRKIAIPYESLNERIRIMANEVEAKSEREHYVGTLLKADVRNNRFTFEPDGKEIISGKVPPELDRTYEVPQRYNIVVEARLSTNEVTGHEKIEYILINAIKIDH